MFRDVGIILVCLVLFGAAVYTHLDSHIDKKIDKKIEEYKTEQVENED